MEPITVHYSEAMIRRAVRAFWLRTLGVQLAPAFAIIALSLSSVYMLDRETWTVPLLSALALIVVVVAAAGYVVHMRNSLGRFHRMNEPLSTLELRERNFKMTSDVASLETRWDLITEVWRFPDVWLLFFDRSAFLILPIATLDSAAQAFILERVKAHGGNVSGGSAAPTLSSPAA